MAKANDFKEFISLLKKAEDDLAKKGYKNVEDNLTLLRGIYYGTKWSKDFSSEGSDVRNFGFTLFTGFKIPQDVKSILEPQIFEDLQNSQDLYSNDKKQNIDIGHVFIGLDARNSQIGREVVIPGHGGTGLEIVTWLGDLGGGAANLAWKRATINPNTNVSYIFNSISDYGASINLEGDIGGLLIGSSPNLNQISVPNYSGITIAQLFNNYLPLSTKPNPLWLSRANNFLRLYGAQITNNSITNKIDLINRFSEKIKNFASFYLAQRYIIPNPIEKSKFASVACAHLSGASSEISTVFVNSLENSLRKPTLKIVGTAPFSIPTPKGRCDNIMLNNIDKMNNETILRIINKDTLNTAKKILDKIIK